ncbi:MAG: choice-of-anchor D domain-containing protein, partial [Desulfuromonadaceae bacterium]
PYGLDVESKIIAGYTTSQALTAVESLDSDSDAYNNITEINNLTFPGDPNDKPGAAPAPNIALSSTSLSFGTVAVGNSVIRTTQIQNSGNAGLDVTAIALGAGTSTEYTFSPAAPFTVAAGSSTVLSVTYTPVDATTDSGSVNISSNDADTPTATVNVSGAGAEPQPSVVDIDITGVTATGRISLGRVKPATVALSVSNPGSISSGTGLATATLVGVQNSVQIYSQTIALDNIAAGATASYTFPAYTPTVVGDINWTVTVSDQDADVDQATAITKIVK